MINSLLGQALSPPAAVGGKYRIGSAVAFGNLRLFKNNMVFGAFEPPSLALVELLYLLVPLAGIGLVVAVGKNPLNFRMFRQPLPVSLQGAAVVYPKPTTPSSKLQIDLVQLMMYELNPRIAAVL